MTLMHFGLFLSGALMVACLVAGLFFQRFYKQTGDKFFRSFALAFYLLAVERIALLLLKTQQEEQTYVYFFRLLAFLLIILAILAKNRPNAP